MSQYRQRNRRVITTSVLLGVGLVAACGGSGGLSAEDSGGSAGSSSGGATGSSSSGATGSSTGTGEDGSEPLALITLPLEVFGVDGTVREIVLPAAEADAPVSQATQLSLTLHNVRYATKASVQVNESEWIPLTNETTRIAEPARSFGGIGGGFAVLFLTVDIPAGTLRDGANTIRFRFDKTNGLSMGYRVLALDLLDAAGTRLLSPSLFAESDPAEWTSPEGADAVKGEDLWSHAELREGPTATAMLRAHCSDCHAEDGRDLKYFGYSNESIIERAKFHGLSEDDGRDMAAYIRSLDVATQGRPWDPPFQPGIGNTLRPLAAFSAGAGLAAVVSEDATIDALFQSGFDRSALADGNALRRIPLSDIPVGLQLPDWNHWLPEIHPKDSVGESFDGSDAAAAFGLLQARLAGLTPPEMEKYKRNMGDTPFLFPDGSLRSDFNGWRNAAYDARSMVLGLPIGEFEGEQPTEWNDLLAREVYAAFVWSQVKTWELMSKYDLEDYALVAYPEGEARAWLSERHLFDTSPFLLGIRGGPDDCPPDTIQCDALWTGSSIGNTRANYDYLSNSWYHLQLTLNGGQRACGGHQCTDFGYAYGFLNGVQDATGVYEGGRRLLWGLKAMDEGDTGLGPIFYDGFSFATANVLRPLRLDDPAAFAWWTDDDHPRRRTALELSAQVWAEKLATWSVERWREENYGKGEDGANFLDASRVVGEGSSEDQARSLGDGLWGNVAVLRDAGLPPAVVNALARFGLAMWPANDWAAHGFPPVGDAPQAPSGIAMGGQVTVTWAPTPGATSHNVHRATSPDGPWLTVALLRTGSSYVDVAPTQGVSLYYAISANAAASESPLSSSTAVSPP